MAVFARLSRARRFAVAQDDSGPTTPWNLGKIGLMQTKFWKVAAALVGGFSFVSASAAAPKQPVPPAETSAAPQSSPDFSDRLVPIRSRRIISYYFEPRIVSGIRLITDKAAGQNRLVASEMSLGFLDWNHWTLPLYGSFESGAFKIEGRNFGVSVKASPNSAGKIFVIYRFAPDLSTLTSAHWAWDYLNPLVNDKRPAAGTYYQFRVLCGQAEAVRGFKDFTVVSDYKGQILGRQDQPIQTR